MISKMQDKSLGIQQKYQVFLFCLHLGIVGHLPGDDGSLAAPEQDHALPPPLCAPPAVVPGPPAAVLRPLRHMLLPLLQRYLLLPPRGSVLQPQAHLAPTSLPRLQKQTRSKSKVMCSTAIPSCEQRNTRRDCVINNISLFFIVLWYVLCYT